MQNEANFGKAQMNVNKVLTKDYENKPNWTPGENEPKTNPIQTQILKTGTRPKTQDTSLESEVWALESGRKTTYDVL